MPKTLFKQLEFYHTIKSKNVQNGKLLLIIDYDYFLQKRDFKTLLLNFEKIYLIPIEQSLIIYSNHFSEDSVLEKYNNLTIIYNPSYQKYFGNTIELNFKKESNITIKNVFNFCEDTLKKCYVSDNINISNPNIINLNYFNLFTRIIKKTLDWAIGFAIYLLSQPLWLISALKINMESPGPIFFKQERVGIRNCEIKVIKFRSMNNNAEINGAQFSSRNDNRIFKWGKIMRGTRIDELPQLFNILKGELSLVGPRPERRIFTESFEELIPHYRERHAVKPGISGYAQIMYPYGVGLKDARHKLMYDLYYIKNWTPLLEIKVILLTIWTVISKKGI